MASACPTAGRFKTGFSAQCTGLTSALESCGVDEDFDRVVAHNLRASFDLVRAFGAPMVARGSGSIIGFASFRAMVTEPGQAVYAATKAGLVQLLRTAAAEFGPQGVRVSAIAPGVAETPHTRQIKDDPAWYDAYAAKSALGRWATPEEMAGAVVFLAGDAATFVPGSCLLVRRLDRHRPAEPHLTTTESRRRG